jgi:hypothetical protein
MTTTTSHHFRHHPGHQFARLRRLIVNLFGFRWGAAPPACPSYGVSNVIGGGREKFQCRLQRLSSRDLTDLVGMLDRCVNFRVSEADFSRFRDMIFDAGDAIAAHCGAKCHQFTIAGG